MTDIKTVLEDLRGEGLVPGAAWHRAHELAQAHEGEAAYDRLHAFLHRVEGDLSNAHYWYRRSGESTYQGDIASECDLLIGRAS